MAGMWRGSVNTKRFLLAGALIAAISIGVSTQSSVTGKWRAMVLRPEGQQADVTMDLKVDGAAVSGTITGPPFTIRDGRIEGDTLTLNLANPNGQAATLTGQISGDEMSFAGSAWRPSRFISSRCGTGGTRAHPDRSATQRSWPRSSSNSTCRG